nr:MAG TPA: hypothetical protein [Caudoviricetes sp.]
MAYSSSRAASAPSAGFPRMVATLLWISASAAAGSRNVVINITSFQA